MSVRVGRHDEPGAVYIGRGSPLGNPFVIGRDGDRDAVCDRYEAWFAERVATRDPAVLGELRRLYRLASQGELVLGCFCSPRRCHGETIKRFLESHLSGGRCRLGETRASDSINRR